MGIFIDIEGAFDGTPQEVLNQAVSDRGVEETLTKWIKELLRSRHLTGRLAGAKRRIKLGAGCLQGGVLSPLLWCLVVDELIRRLNKLGFYTQGYANDIVVLIMGRFLDVLSGQLAEVIRVILEWCAENGLRLNPLKVALVPFTKKRLSCELLRQPTDLNV